MIIYFIWCGIIWLGFGLLVWLVFKYFDGVVLFIVDYCFVVDIYLEVYVIVCFSDLLDNYFVYNILYDNVVVFVG